MCTTDEEQFATVQVRASTDKKCLKRIDTNRHQATQTYHYNQFVHTKTASGFRIQGSDPGQRDLLFSNFTESKMLVCNDKIWLFSEGIGNLDKLC